MNHSKSSETTFKSKTGTPQNGTMAQRFWISFNLHEQEHAGMNDNMMSRQSLVFNSPVAPFVLMINHQEVPSPIEPADLALTQLTGSLSRDLPLHLCATSTVTFLVLPLSFCSSQDLLCLKCLPPIPSPTPISFVSFFPESQPDLCSPYTFSLGP